MTAESDPATPTENELQMPKPFSRVLEMTILFVFAFSGCAGDPIDTASTVSGGAAASDYTGLGEYTGISGAYGNGITSSIGGTSATSLGGNGQGGAPSAGGTLAADGVTTAETGGTTIAAGGRTRTGTVASTSGASGGRAMGGGSAGGASTRGTNRGGAGTTGGSATGGSATSSSSATGDSGSVWPDNYNPAGKPSDPTGKHSPGTNCMSSACHASTQTSRAFAFGGTIYQPGGTTAAANVQVAIASGTTTVTTYSAANGNFWLPLASAPSINWATATVYLRNGKGEVAKASGTDVSSGCNSCHGSTMRIASP